MCMYVDPAWGHKKTLCINVLPSLSDILSHGNDAALANANIAHLAAGATTIDNRAITYC